MKARIAALVLVLIGCVHMAADVAGFDGLKAIANATQASPAMKVFTSHEEYETFSPQFEIRYRGIDGEARVLPLTPAAYGRLEGPYNRRNAYGAALAYSPVLMAAPATRGIVDAVMRYAFCDPGALMEELPFIDPAPAAPISIVVIPRRRVDPSRVLSFEVTCHE